MWLAWRFEWIDAGFHGGDCYRVCGKAGWVAWASIAGFSVETVGTADGPKQTEFLWYTNRPYYHKKVFFSIGSLTRTPAPPPETER